MSHRLDFPLLLHPPQHSSPTNKVFSQQSHSLFISTTPPQASMVRASLSFLFALATLFALAILSESRPYTIAPAFKIINAETDGWAKNFPSGAGRPPFNTGVIVDDQFASIYERWQIERFEEGFKIQNVGTGYWLTARDGEVYGSSEFDERDSMWYVEAAGDDLYTIKVPNEDTVMTALRKKAGYPISIYLEPADGGDTQKWRLQPLLR